VTVDHALRIPEGWTLEPMTGMRDLFVVVAPGIGAATIDFQQRGFRLGMFVLSGSFVGAKLTRRGYEQKKYEGRGWKQKLVDDTVASLEAVPPWKKVSR
jgi:hypothetical protein